MALDFDSIQAELAHARQTNRKMCTIHVDDLQSLISRATELKKVQDLIPSRVGYCRPADLHNLMEGYQFVIPMRARKSKAYCVTICANWVPDKPKFNPETE